MVAEWCYSILPSPIGELLLVGSETALVGLHMGRPGHPPRPEKDWRCEDAALATAREQLLAYFAGERIAFDLVVDPAGTSFQKRVWAELCRIPYGETISYAELARRVGVPKAARAVGSANGRNPIGIIIPCHRVIAADGTLGGYGGGLSRKEWLLHHEATVVGWLRGGTTERAAPPRVLPA